MGFKMQWSAKSSFSSIEFVELHLNAIVYTLILIKDTNTLVVFKILAKILSILFRI